MFKFSKSTPDHLDQGAAELVEEDEEEVDEGEDEHDAQDGDEGVRRLPRQKRVAVGQVDGGALKANGKTRKKHNVWIVRLNCLGGCTSEFPSSSTVTRDDKE